MTPADPSAAPPAPPDTTSPKPGALGDRLKTLLEIIKEFKALILALTALITLLATFYPALKDAVSGVFPFEKSTHAESSDFGRCRAKVAITRFQETDFYNVKACYGADTVDVFYVQLAAYTIAESYEAGRSKLEAVLNSGSMPNVGAGRIKQQKERVGDQLVYTLRLGPYNSKIQVARICADIRSLQAAGVSLKPSDFNCVGITHFE